MINEICVAGIDESHNWMRPIRQPSLNLLKSDIFQGDLCVIKNYNVVRFLSQCKLNNMPHSEDFVVNWSQKPIVIDWLDESTREDLFLRIDETDYVEGDITSYLLNNNRSLILIKPEEICGLSWSDSFKYKPRIRFKFNKISYNFSCTDIKWRAYGRESKNRQCAMDMLSNNNIYFVIGLTREFKGTYWPMVVGVHMIPDIEVSIDYSNL